MVLFESPLFLSFFGVLALGTFFPLSCRGDLMEFSGPFVEVGALRCSALIPPVGSRRWARGGLRSSSEGSQEVWSPERTQAVP